jgi:hypothetical protein
MKKVIDDLVYTFFKGDFPSLSSFPDNYFKKYYDWQNKKETEDLYFISWGENLHGTNHGVLETGFFSNSVHIDRHGLYSFASFNLNTTRQLIESYQPLATARDMFNEGLLQPKFRQCSLKYTWDKIVLMCQHPTDRSILKAGTTRQYYEFIEQACKYYGKNLLLKVHPVNSKEIIERIKSIAIKYDSFVDEISMDVVNTCEYVIVYNSTAVVDCLLRNVPVLQYAPGYFWKSGTVDFSDRTFRTPQQPNHSFNQQFCNFLVWKYCFYKLSPMSTWNEILNCYATAKEDFPLPEKYSYANFLLNKI